MLSIAISSNMIISFPSYDRKWLYMLKIGGAADLMIVTVGHTATCVPIIVASVVLQDEQSQVVKKIEQH